MKYSLKISCITLVVLQLLIMLLMVRIYSWNTKCVWRSLFRLFVVLWSFVICIMVCHISIDSKIKGIKMPQLAQLRASSNLLIKKIQLHIQV